MSVALVARYRTWFLFCSHVFKASHYHVILPLVSSPFSSFFFTIFLVCLGYVRSFIARPVGLLWVATNDGPLSVLDGAPDIAEASNYDGLSIQVYFFLTILGEHCGDLDLLLLLLSLSSLSSLFSIPFLVFLDMVLLLLEMLLLLQFLSWSPAYLLGLPFFCS